MPIVDPMYSNFKDVRPDELLRLLGSIILTWGRIESRLTELVIVVTKVEPGVGHMAFGKMDATEKFRKAIEIMKFRKMPEMQGYKALFKACSGVKTLRNFVAHWVFVGFDEQTQTARFANIDGTYLGDDGELKTPIKDLSMSKIRELEAKSLIVDHLLAKGRPPDESSRLSVIEDFEVPGESSVSET